MAQQSALQAELGSPKLSSRRKRVGRHASQAYIVLRLWSALVLQCSGLTLPAQEIGRELTRLELEQAEVLEAAKKVLLQT